MCKIEKFIMPKTGDSDKCEDMLVETEYFCAVIDGVTSKYDTSFDGKAGGRKAAEIIAKIIEGLDEKAEANTVFHLLNDALKKACEEYNVEVGKHLQACVIIYSKYYKEIWNYGDCTLMINGKEYRHEKAIDGILEGLRAFVIYSYLKDGGKPEELYKNDIGRDAILPYLKMQTAFANEKGYFGYPVLNGDKIVEESIIKYKVKTGDRVILASDGYPRLFPTLKESEEYLKKVLENDPLSICDNMQTKMTAKDNLSFDDRTYFSFTAE
ncbi:MAG: hypothetical protein IJ323_02260 [Clostridia bacterium]|nr:hypothetical protein [Clostridia bacterium]